MKMTARRTRARSEVAVQATDHTSRRWDLQATVSFDLEAADRRGARAGSSRRAGRAPHPEPVWVEVRRRSPRRDSRRNVFRAVCRKRCQARPGSRASAGAGHTRVMQNASAGAKTTPAFLRQRVRAFALSPRSQGTNTTSLGASSRPSAVASPERTQAPRQAALSSGRCRAPRCHSSSFPPTIPRARDASGRSSSALSWRLAKMERERAGKRAQEPPRSACMPAGAAPAILSLCPTSR
jgi:hypothetical protein